MGAQRSVPFIPFVLDLFVCYETRSSVVQWKRRRLLAYGEFYLHGNMSLFFINLYENNYGMLLIII